MSESHWSGEAKYRALLAVAEAANSRLDLSSVLDAVAGALTGLVPIDAIGVITREGETLRPIAIHSRNDPRRDDESAGEYVRRLTEAAGVARDAPADALAHLEHSGGTLVVDDVQRDPRLGHAAYVKRSGAECLVLARLVMGAHLVGGITFVRMSRSPFSPGR